MKLCLAEIKNTWPKQTILKRIERNGNIFHTGSINRTHQVKMECEKGTNTHDPHVSGV